MGIDEMKTADKPTGIDGLVRSARADQRLAAGFAVAELCREAGGLLRAMRTRAAKTQKQLAAELDVSQPRIAQVESGKVEKAPSLDFLARYAAACDEDIHMMTRREYETLVKERDAAVLMLKRRNPKFRWPGLGEPPLRPSGTISQDAPGGRVKFGKVPKGLLSRPDKKREGQG